MKTLTGENIVEHLELCPRQREKHMTNALKRRVYLYCVFSIVSFLAAFLVYDLLDIGIFTNRLFFPCAMLWTTGALFAFKAVDTWSGWETDTSEDTEAILSRINPYPTVFSITAILMMLMVVFLFVSAVIRNQPTMNETCILAFGLVGAEICILLNRLSSRLSSDREY